MERNNSLSRRRFLFQALTLIAALVIAIVVLLSL